MSRFARKLLIVVSCFIVFASANAQNASVRGFVYDKETGEAALFTNVYLKGTTKGAITDVNGFYNISKIKPGNYTLMVSYIGYDTLSLPISLKAGEILTRKLFLKQSNVKLEEFTVSAEHQEMLTTVKASIIKITPKQMNKLPTIGSEPDLAQYLQVLPGVIFTGDQGGQLYIRGGSPIQNKVLLDGMIVYNPFHSIGLFSVFDADIIKNADIYTGGFNAEYGGRISSIMDITTRDGNKTRLAGKLSTNVFGSKILLEGPLKKMTEEQEGSSSFIVSAKTSYLEQTSKVLYNYIDTAGLPFNFTDLYGKLSFNSKNGSKANFFAYHFSDKVNYQALSNLNWNSYGVGTNAVLVPTGSSMLIKANASFSSYSISLKDLSNVPRNSLINGFNIALSFIYFIGANELDYGIETLGFKTLFEYQNIVNRKIEQEENTTEMAVYAKYKLTLGKLLLEPGFRYHYYASLSNGSAEPRLGVKYNMLDNFRLKFAGGFYSQNLIAANSDRDVVNLFYGFLSGSDNLPKEFDGKKVKHYLQKSFHLISGFEYDINRKMNLNVEGYLKRNTQLTNINRNKLYDDTGENHDKPDYLKKDFIIETGNAYGVDFLLKYDYKRVYLWFVYSLGYIDRYDGIRTYVPHFDRRHNINLVGSYTFGENLNWEIGTRWNLGSGFPFTRTRGFYELVPFNEGLNTDYTTINGEMGIIYGNLNEGRLPYYHRLDISVKRRFDIGDNANLLATLSITNVYNRENIFYFDRIKWQRVNQLPIMPSIGMSLKF